MIRAIILILFGWEYLGVIVTFCFKLAKDMLYKRATRMGVREDFVDLRNYIIGVCYENNWIINDDVYKDKFFPMFADALDLFVLWPRHLVRYTKICKGLRRFLEDCKDYLDLLQNKEP